MHRGGISGSFLSESDIAIVRLLNYGFLWITIWSIKDNVFINWDAAFALQVSIGF